MSIIDDPLFVQPPNDAKIWRYMDISKLVSILNTGSLFFPRADRFSDAWEGSVSLNDVIAFYDTVAGGQEKEEERKRLKDNHRRAFSGFRRHTYISCWHENSGESDAMWKLYLKSDEGIALQTSFGRLHRQLETCPREIRLGKVKYLDYRRESIPGSTPIGHAYVVGQFAPFIHKRAGFVHEAEVRAIFQDRYETVDDRSEAEDGLPIKVNIEELVEGVYLAPLTKKWFRDSVQSILDRFGINRQVHQSQFDELPPCYFS